MMKAIKVLFRPKNPQWQSSTRWYIVGTEIEQDAIDRASDMLKVHEPKHFERYRAECAHIDIL